MAYLQIIGKRDADGDLLAAYQAMAARPMPSVYQPDHGDAPGIIRAHSLDPELLRRAFAVSGSLSNDLSEVASALAHGLQHLEAGRVTEALWWWQFSYLSSWGDSASRALRVLHTVLRHVRLDADEETVADAEFDALHP